MKRMLTSISLLLPALLGLLVLQATPAQAAARNGVCDDGEFCYYYNSNQAGAVSDFTSSIPDLGATQPHCYDFKGTAPGHGQCTKNHAASVWNRSKTPVTVYYNSNYAGHAQTIQPGAKANLDTTLKNNNASHRYGTTTPPPSGDVPHNPRAGANGANGGMTPRAAWLRDLIKSRYGMSCTSYATSDRSSEHYTGNALDCWGTLAQRRQLAQWTADHAATLEVYYVIHETKIWSLPRKSEGWRAMKKTGDPTADHLDHVHISLQHPGHEY